MRFFTIIAALYFPASAIAQTAPADRGPVQRPQPPTLQQSIDTAEATVNRVVTDFGNTIASLANQVEALKQQLAEANQTIAARDKTIADLKAPKTDEGAKPESTAKP